MSKCNFFWISSDSWISSVLNAVLHAGLHAASAFLQFFAGAFAGSRCSMLLKLLMSRKRTQSQRENVSKQRARFHQFQMTTNNFHRIWAWGLAFWSQLMKWRQLIQISSDSPIQDSDSPIHQLTDSPIHQHRNNRSPKVYKQQLSQSQTSSKSLLNSEKGTKVQNYVISGI